MIFCHWTWCEYLFLPHTNVYQCLEMMLWGSEKKKLQFLRPRSSYTCKSPGFLVSNLLIKTAPDKYFSRQATVKLDIIPSGTIIHVFQSNLSEFPSPFYSSCEALLCLSVYSLIIIFFHLVKSLFVCSI